MFLDSYPDWYMVFQVRLEYAKSTDKNSIMLIKLRRLWRSHLETPAVAQTFFLITWSHGQAEMLDHVKFADKDDMTLWASIWSSFDDKALGVSLYCLCTGAHKQGQSRK